MKSSKENISPTSFDYFRQLCASRQNREKTDKSISEELFVPQVTLFSNSSKQNLKNDPHNIFGTLNIKQNSLISNGNSTIMKKKFRHSAQKSVKPLFNTIVEKLKKASNKISRYSLKRKSFLFTDQDQNITQQNAWINILNDDYSNSKIKKSKINQSFFYYYSYYYKIINNFIILFSFLSIILAVVNNELYICNSQKYLLNLNPSEKDNIYYYNSEFFNLDNFRKLSERKISVVENTFIIINIIISTILSVLLWIHVHFKIKIQLHEKKISEYDTIFSLGFFPKYLIETLIALICIPPTVNKVYTGSIGENDFIYTIPGMFLLFSFLKILLIIDNSNNLTRYNNKVAKSILRNNKTQSGLRYVIKCFYKSKPILTIIISFSFAVLVLIEIIRAFEMGSFSRNQKLLGKKGVNDLWNYFNCFWLVLTTILSVGFGDVSPRSPIGRVAIIVACFLGNIFLSLFIISFATFSEFTPNQRKAFAKLSKIFDKDNTENKAANVIKYLLLIKKFLKKGKRGKSEKFGLLSLLITHINQYKNIDQVYDNVKNFMEDPSQAASKSDEVRKIKEMGAEKVYEDNDWLIIVPKTREAAIYYGKGTKWCTASTDSYNYFERYNNEGRLYININKNTGDKYQFHFESNSFMDAEDKPIKGIIAEEIGLSSGAEQFYASLGEDQEYAISSEEHTDPYEEPDYPQPQESEIERPK